MIDHEFGPPYEHSELDLCGKWDSLDSITIGFLLARDDSAPGRSTNYLRRSSALTKRINEVFFSVSVELKTVFELPTAKEGQNPLILPSEFYLEEPTEGIMIVQAGGLQEEVEDPMERCLARAAEVYGDLMYQRVRQ